MNVDFCTNKTSVEIIKEGTFEGTYFSINGKWYRKSLKEFDELKNIDQNHYCSNYYDLMLINIVLNVEHH